MLLRHYPLPQIEVPPFQEFLPESIQAFKMFSSSIKPSLAAPLPLWSLWQQNAPFTLHWTSPTTPCEYDEARCLAFD